MSTGIGDLVVSLGLNFSPFTSGLAASNRGMTSFASGVTRSIGMVKSVLAPLSPLLAGIGAAMAFGSAVNSARDAVQQQRKLEAVLKATGGAAGLTSQEITGLAGDLSMMTNFEDDATTGAAGVLATFKEIKGDTFKDALKSAQDMASVMDGDLQGSIVQVGKALNDPTKGMSALSKVGVSFTAQQKNQIKALQASGDMMGAQKVILDELKSEFGGAAQAMADPFVIAQNTMGNVAETIGGFLLPTVNALMSGFTELMMPIANAGGAVGDIGQKIGDLIGTYLTPFVTVGQTLIGWLVDGFMLLGPAIDFVIGLVNRSQDAWGSVLTPLYDGIQTAVDTYLPMLIDGWDFVVESAELIFASLVAGLEPIFSSIGTALYDTFMPIYDAITAAVTSWLPSLSSGFAATGEFIGQVVQGVAFFFRNMSELSQIAVIDLLTFIMDNVPFAEQAFTAIAANAIGVFAGLKAGMTEWVKSIIAGFQEISNFAKAVFAGVYEAFAAAMSGKNPLAAFQDSFQKTLASQKDVQGGQNPFTAAATAYQSEKDKFLQGTAAKGGLSNALKAQKSALQDQIGKNESAFSLRLQAPGAGGIEAPPPPPTPTVKASQAGTSDDKAVKVEAIQMGSAEAFSTIQNFLQGGSSGDVAKQQLAVSQQQADEQTRQANAAERQAEATERLVDSMEGGYGG